MFNKNIDITKNRFFDAVREGKNGAGRYLLTIFVVFVTALISSTIVGGVAMFVEGTTDLFAFSPLAFLLVAMLPNVAMLLALWLCLRVLHQRPLVSLVSPERRVRWEWVILSALIWFGLAFLSDVIGYVTNAQNYTFSFDAAQLLPYLALGLLLVPLQTSFEELLFRGYLTQWSGLLTRSVVLALILPSLLFGLLHGANPEVGLYGWGWMMASYIGIGLLLGWITLRSQGLELALGLHAANNLYALLVTFPGSALPSPALVTLRSYDARLSLVALVVSAIIYLVLMRGPLNARRDETPEFVKDA